MVHTFKRSLALFCSFFASLAGGTPYLYGVYAPQFKQQVGLSATAAATMALAINIGGGIGGLPAGLIIDHFGPQASILLGSFFIMGCYLGLYQIYQTGYNNLGVICITMVGIGFGSISTYFASLKATQANFPNHRGSAGAVPVGTYGLAATIFSLIAANFFHNNTGGLLKFLAIFCGGIAFFASWFVHVYLGHEDEDVEDEQTPLLNNKPSSSSLNNKPSLNSLNSTEFAISLSEGSTIEHPPRSRTEDSLRGSLSFWGLGSSLSRSSSMSSLGPDSQLAVQSVRDQSAVQNPSSNRNTSFLSSTNNVIPNATPIKKKTHSKNPLVTIRRLLTNRIFLIHFCLMSLVTGISQMYIFSVGFVVTAQFNYSDKSSSLLPNLVHFHSPKVAGASSPAPIQALQVSLISICSFSGRVAGGFLCDYIHKRFRLQRLWVTAITIIFLIAGQLSLVFNNSNIHLITVSSILIGGSFGLILGTYPAIIADGFGTRTFSTTWGLICTSPLITLFTLNKYFGSIYDKHTDPLTGICYAGGACYRGAFELSSLLCTMAFFMALLLIYIQRK